MAMALMKCMRPWWGMGDSKRKNAESLDSAFSLTGRGSKIRTHNKGFGDPRVTITPCPYDLATESLYTISGKMSIPFRHKNPLMGEKTGIRAFRRARVVRVRAHLGACEAILIKLYRPSSPPSRTRGIPFQQSHWKRARSTRRPSFRETPSRASRSACSGQPGASRPA